MIYKVELKEDRDNPKITLIKDMGHQFTWQTVMTPLQAEDLGKDLLVASYRARGLKWPREK